MATEPRVLYEFGPFRVDPDKQLLLRENGPVALTPKAFETLLALIRHSREVVSKEELMQAVWPDAFVEEANLSQSIFVLRKALGDTPEDRRYIVTVPGRGYRFAADVRTVPEGGESLLIASRSRSPVVIEQAGSASVETSPALFQGRQGQNPWKYSLPIGGALGLLLLGLSYHFFRRQPVPLGTKDSVLIADFTNTTGNSVFDDTLRQGLEVQLEQSPFLSVESQDRVQQTLRLMGQPSDARLTPGLAQQVCERIGGAAVLDGSIARVGSQYVLGLRATNCQTGDVLDDEQVQAAKEEDVLSALSQVASRFRTRVGESLATVRQHDTPLAQATTPSLKALKAYSEAWQVNFRAGGPAAIPLVKRAIEIDPKFAMAYAFLGRLYGDVGETVLSAQNVTRAYQLRDQVSDREKFFIIAMYERQVTGNLEKARETCKVWARIYPRDAVPPSLLSGAVSVELGQYEDGAEEARKVITLDPDFAFGYTNLALDEISLGRLDQAEAALQQASERKLDIPDLFAEQYDIAFLKGDRARMERVAALSQGKSGVEDYIADKEAYVLAYSGRLREARRMTERAVTLAQTAGQSERSAQYEAAEAVREALFGNALEARQAATAALALSRGRDVEYGAAMALAISGKSSLARTLASNLDKRFPEDTLVRFNYVPTLRALLALRDREPSRAIQLLESARPYELGSPVSDSVGFAGALYPIYVRGEAYLALRQGAEAAAEFQDILNHSSIVVSDPIGALARLQLARAYSLSGNTLKAKTAYQDFLTIWENADPDVPILKRAMDEYRSLNKL